MFCLLSSAFLFFGDKVSACRFKDEIIPSLKANYRLKSDRDVEKNHLIDKGKTRCKLSYKLFKEEYGYDTLLDISTYPTFIKLKDFPGGIHHCVTVLG